jgi:nucleotide-binding universal stress UspA family protein
MKKVEIKKILVPVDFTETSQIALNEAINLATLLNAKLFLINVIEFNQYTVGVAREFETMVPPILELETIAKNNMNKLVTGIESKNPIKTESMITSGDISTEIISYSKKKKIDLIVMGTHGASGYKELFIGSNAQRVVTLSDIPVLTFQKKLSKAGFKNILIPIDNSMHSREKVGMAMTIASAFKSKLHLVGLPDSQDKTELNKFKIKLSSVEKIIVADKLTYTTTIAKGKSLAKAAIDYAEKNKCDLIVINTGHESKITGIFLGAFAQQIVNHSSIPVLSMKHTSDHFVIETPGFGV